MFKCPMGTYTDATGQAECNDCTAGQECSAFGLQAARTCAAGYYCPSRQYFLDRALPYQEYPCDRGTQSSGVDRATSDDCTACSET